MQKIKCLVIDDEELARVLLKTYIDKVDFLDLIDLVENPIDGMKIMKETSVDVVFLDIQMAELKGTEFAKMIDTKTQIIFTTAYSEYAVEGFNLNALDYLLKPITFERFLTAVNKIKPTDSPLFFDETITIKSGYDLFKLNLNDIIYIESDSEYVNFYTTEKKIMSHQTIKSLEKTLPKSMFMRVHRSYIVNKNKVKGLKGKDLLISDAIIPVSDSHFNAVKKELF